MTLTSSMAPRTSHRSLGRCQRAVLRLPMRIEAGVIIVRPGGPRPEEAGGSVGRSATGVAGLTPGTGPGLRQGGDARQAALPRVLLANRRAAMCAAPRLDGDFAQAFGAFLGCGIGGRLLVRP